MASMAEIPWVPVAVGAGVLVGGVVLYRAMKKPAATAAVPAAAKPGGAAKPAPYSPAASAAVDKAQAEYAEAMKKAAADSAAAKKLVQEGDATYAQKQAEIQAAKAKRDAEYEVQKQKNEGEYLGKLATIDAKYLGQAAESSVTSWQDSASGDSAAFGMRDADRFRVSLHDALCDHPDYLGIGFARVGGRVGLAVASTRPMQLPPRIGPMPVVGCW
jgi:hypothetical protein